MNEVLYAQILDVIADAVIAVDGAGSIVYANASTHRLLGYDPQELIGRPLEMLIPMRHKARHSDYVAEFRKQGQAKAMGSRPVLYAVNKAGKEVPVSISIGNLDIPDGRISVAVIHDAAAVRNHLKEATSQAETDSLTGVGNRLRLTHHIQRAIQDQRPFTLLFLDLTKFKPFNDRYGHEIGDEVLRLVAQRLQAMVRSNDLVVRFGGDEFVMMLKGVADMAFLDVRMAFIAETLSRPFALRNVTSTIGVNIGASIYPRDGETEEDLLRVADRNMYLAKNSQQPFMVGANLEAGDGAKR